MSYESPLAHMVVKLSSVERRLMNEDFALFEVLRLGAICKAATTGPAAHFHQGA